MSRLQGTKNSPGYMGVYRLLNKVHAGHASQLWQAFDDGKNRMVGVKIVSEKFCKDREQIRYLRNEFKIGSKVVHPKIIEVYCFDFDRGIPYVAMEWFSAPNMKQRIQQGIEKLAKITPRIIEEAATGLAFLNSRGWVHRDIKPDNFLVSDEGEVKLIDLGISVRACRGWAKWFARKSKVQGTRSYISPEQLRGEAVDQRADVYSFGCTIHELLAGKPPFTGMNANELLNKHLKSPPPPLESVNSNVTPEFGQLIRKCLAKEAKQRIASLDDFLEEFRTCRLFKITPRPGAG